VVLVPIAVVNSDLNATAFAGSSDDAHGLAGLQDILAGRSPAGLAAE
jgi:hypothetical protein